MCIRPSGPPLVGPLRARGDVNAVGVSAWATGEELFATTPDGLVHHLTGAQWQEIGDPPPSIQTDQGYEKLTWAPAIARMSSLSRGAGAPVSYAQWAAAGFPTPRALPRLPGDRFYRYPGEQTIYYAGPTMNRALTFDQWSAAGSPTPTAPPPGAPAHTVRTSITPVSGPARVVGGDTVTSTAAGQCIGSSEAGSDLAGATQAYRCLAGNTILDPCWNAVTRPASVLCLGTPWSKSATRVTLGSAPDRSQLDGAGGEDYPWGLELTDGRRCVALQGAHAGDAGRAVDYTCTESAQVLRGLDEGSPSWRADVVRPAGGGDTAPVTVSVQTAWYVSPTT